jgi:indolepyruvate ferredoxin oxidoreductase beta subunit
VKTFNVYLTGVGGQGIGLLSEVVLRAADHAGHPVKSVDTHGLAQRGGIVISQIRIGDELYSPLIPTGQADLVISLERHEALRAARTVLKPNGCLIYYNTVWQPLSVRLDEAAEVTQQEIEDECKDRGLSLFCVYQENLPDIRMQNMAVLSIVHQQRLIPRIGTIHYKMALKDLMSGRMLEDNLSQLFP